MRTSEDVPHYFRCCDELRLARTESDRYRFSESSLWRWVFMWGALSPNRVSHAAGTCEAGRDAIGRIQYGIDGDLNCNE